MADDYDDILNRQWDEIPEPSVLPGGTYVLVGRGAKYNPPKEEGKSGFVNFGYAVEGPIEIDDPDEAEELGADYDYAENDVFYRIWVERAKDWARVRDHLRRHGLDIEGASVQDSLKAFRGTKVGARLGIDSYVDRSGEERTQNVASEFAPLED